MSTRVEPTSTPCPPVLAAAVQPHRHVDVFPRITRFRHARGIGFEEFVEERTQADRCRSLQIVNRGFEHDSPQSPGSRRFDVGRPRYSGPCHDGMIGHVCYRMMMTRPAFGDELSKQAFAAGWVR